jgi:hypothetical protein
MFYRILGAATLCCLSFLVQAQKSQPQVKSLQVRAFVANQESFKLHNQSSTSFNEAGLVTKRIFFAVDSLGVAKKSRQVIYNYSSNNILTSVSRFNNANTLEWEEEYFYDALGFLIRVEYHDYTQAPKGKNAYATYSYDTNGNKVRYSYYNAKGILAKEVTWSYNDIGDVILNQAWELQENGKKTTKVKSTIENELDKNGALARSIYTQENGNSTFKEIRVFENNFVKEWTKYQDGRLVSHFSNKDVRNFNSELEAPIPMQEELIRNENYEVIWSLDAQTDDEGKPLRAEKYNKSGSVVSVYNFEYDDNRNLIKTTRTFEAEKLVEETITEYDKYNNRTLELVKENGKTISKVEFGYEYFD